MLTVATLHHKTTPVLQRKLIATRVTAGRARQGASHAAFPGSQSRGALMQGWRSIMHGSPEQSSGKRSASACSQKSGLDLAWRLNGDCYSP